MSKCIHIYIYLYIHRVKYEIQEEILNNCLIFCTSVFRKPQITNPRTDPMTEVEEGQALSTSVTSTAWPLPDFIWSKDGRELTNEDRCTITKEDDGYQRTSSLRIQASTLEDCGKYKVVVKNKHDETENELQILGQ